MDIDPNTKLYIATPAFGCKLHTAYVHALLRTSNVLNNGGISHMVAFLPGDSLITRARNVLVAQFMAGEFTHLLFIDGDIKWEPEAVLRLIAASQFKDIEVAGGIYPKKALPSAFPVNFVAGSESSLNQHPDTGYIEIKDAPTGFLMVRRSAFEKMMAAYPERKCCFRENSPVKELPFEYALFDCVIDSDGRYLSEDFGFSRLWQKCGGKVWMDPEIKLSHYGEFEYRAEISSRLLPADQTGRPVDARQIQGWMTDDELAFLAGAARNVDSIAEVGSWKGRSTFALLSNCTGPVYAVDHWLGSNGERGYLKPHSEAESGDVFSEFLRNCGQFPNLKLVRKPSVEAAAEVPPVDLVFLDGGHEYEEVLADLKAWAPKAKKIICGHDFTDQAWPGVRRAVTETFGEVQRGPGSIWIKQLEV